MQPQFSNKPEPSWAEALGRLVIGVGGLFLGLCGFMALAFFIVPRWGWDGVLVIWIGYIVLFVIAAKFYGRHLDRQHRRPAEPKVTITNILDQHGHGDLN